MKPSPLPPRHQAALELLCLVIHRQKSFRKWFEGLLACPANVRTSALLQMITQMRRDQEDEDLIGAVSALCDPSLCDAVDHAVRSLS